MYLTNSHDVIVNSLSLIGAEKITDVKELFLSKLDARDNIVGLAPDTLNALQQPGEAINNDSNFYATLITDLLFKANAIDTFKQPETFARTEVDSMFTQSLTYTKISLH